MQFIHEGEEQLDMAATLNYGKDYLAVMLIQIPPFALQQVYASTLKESGETLMPMKAGIIAVLVNLVGNYILIFGKLGAPVMGVVGAAIATVISRFVECAIIIIWTHRHRDTNPFVDHAYTTWRIPETLLRQIVVMGLPLLVNELLWSSGMTVLSQCYSMRGLEVVSAVNISTTVSNLFFCAFLSMGNSIAIIIRAAKNQEFCQARATSPSSSASSSARVSLKKPSMRTESSSPLLSRCVPRSAW